MIKHYKKYKDSNVDWIGEIPVEWLNVRLKNISSISKGRKATEDYQDFQEGMIPYLSMEYLRNLTESPIYVRMNDESIVLINEDDLLILWDGSKAGEIVKAKYGALSSTMGKIHILKKEFDLNYVSYYLKNSERYLQDNTVGMGIPHVDGDILRNLVIVQPSIGEQIKIAHFLDFQTGIIDELITQKEKIIELLKEKRQAIINEAITKGLNPGSKMKNSGIKWLGWIPEEWETVTLRYLNNKIGSGVTPKGGADVYVDDGIIFIRSQNVHFDGLRLDDVVKIDLKTHERMSGTKVKFNDVLLNITGASIGRCCVVKIDSEMNVNQHVCIIRTKENLNPEFLNLVLQSNIGQTQISLLITGGNREGLTFEAIKDFVIPVPNISTQMQIVKTVNAFINKGIATTNIINNQITNLKEYRQSLISEAVTGKIDVREWQPNQSYSA